MGLFVSKLQVKLQAKQPFTSVKDFFQRISEHSISLTITSEDESIPLCLACPKDSFWITFFDPSIPEGVLSPILEDTALLLTKALKTFAVLVSVYDSDFLTISLYKNGEKKSHLNSQVLEDEESVLIPSLEPWLDIIDTNSWQTFFEQFTNSTIYADEKLLYLCKLLDWEEHLLLSTNEELSAVKGTKTNNLIVSPVYIKHTNQSDLLPISKKSILPSPSLKQSKFDLLTRRLVYAIGEEAPLQIIIESSGNGFYGIDAYLFGPLVDENCIDLKEYTITVNEGKNFEFSKRISSSLQGNIKLIKKSNGKKEFHIAFDKIEIPECKNSLRQYYLNFWGKGVVKKTKIAPLYFRIEPQQYPESQISLETQKVALIEVNDLPLGIHSFDRMDHDLKAMYYPRYLLAVAILPINTMHLKDTIFSAITKWITICAKNDDKICVRRQALTTDMLKIPRWVTKTVTKEDILSLKNKWKSLADDLLNFQTLEAFCQESSFGSRIQRSLYIHAKKNFEDPIHLSFWIAQEEFDSYRKESLLSSLEEIIKGLFKKNDGFQGWIAQWDWIPLFDNYDEWESTPYEMAHHVKQKISGELMSTRWCETYLRGFGSPMWIGRALQSKLKNRQKLDTIAITNKCGELLQIEYPQNLRFSECEELLEGIIPGQDH